MINSFQENVYIEKLMSNYGQVAPDGGGAEYHWLGASDSINENNWAWADGSTFETSKISGRAFWGDGAGHGIGGSEPDNFNNQDCLALAVTAWPAANPGFYGAAGQWNDIDCDNSLNFIVEYPVNTTYSDGQLSAENISVGDKKYRAELRLIECASICFQVSSATEIEDGSELSINDVSGDILRLRRVNVGATSYDVALKFTDPDSLILTLDSAIETFSVTAVPGETWVTATTEQVGLDAEKFQKVVDYAFGEGQNTQGLVVVRHGSIVFERYAEGSDKDSIATSWSTAKSFTSALAGVAIEKGFISSVDASAAEFISDWSGDERANITLKDLLLMSSGLSEDGDDSTSMYIGVKDENNQYNAVDNVLFSIDRTVNPERARWLGAGYTWNYANADTQILGEIIERSAGKSLLDFARENLFSKIGILATWWTDKFSNYMAYCCLDMTSRNFARFGLLYARDGKWGDVQVLPSEYVIESTAPSIVITKDFPLGYGYHWWPDRSGKWFAAKGSRYNNIYIHPGLDIVVVRNSLYTHVGDSYSREDSYHSTDAPANWDDSEFFNLVIESVN
ncbi:MAG: serine hydrolase [Pseudomonadota bacterium]|nr:serine hydrolase [Pseudomonadota bacterium]